MKVSDRLLSDVATLRMIYFTLRSVDIDMSSDPTCSTQDDITRMPTATGVESVGRSNLPTTEHEDHHDDRGNLSDGRRAMLLLNSQDPEHVSSNSEAIENRNALVHKDPSAITALVNDLYRARVMKQGSFLRGNILFSFHPSEIPFHILYIIMCDNANVYHLASARKVEDPVSLHHFLDGLILTRASTYM